MILSWQQIRSLLMRRMRVVQIVSNLTGAVACLSYFLFFDEIRPAIADVPRHLVFPALMMVLFVIIGISLGGIWLRGTHRFLGLKIAEKPIPEPLARSVERRVLNLPLAFSLIGMFNWTVAALVMPIYFLRGETDMALSIPRDEYYAWAVIGVLLAGVTTSTISYFGTESLCRRIWPSFFPHGQLSSVKGTFRISLRSRILITILLTSILPVLDLAIISYDKAEMMLVMDPEKVLQSLQKLILFTLLLYFLLAVVISRFVTASIAEPVENMKRAMGRIRKGDFTAKAAVMDNGELGDLADHFNHMAREVKERWELRRTLAIAREVQRSLLPASHPDIKGYDIAGQSIYCDETGGDYYDYLTLARRPTVVIGDVSGHGIPSALLMASVRAFLRQRAALPGTMADVMADVNRQFCRDTTASGSFMTLFLLSLATDGLCWVRAGHDPAILYTPDTDTFLELRGEGIPLGIDEACRFEENRYDTMVPGQVLLLATDGLWEAVNEDGQMYGRQRMRTILRNHAEAGSHALVQALLADLKRFTGERRSEDDITLVVIKATGT
jgi:sigma-B regulation protein RsbU (phosphoserine phosphatase)